MITLPKLENFKALKYDSGCTYFVPVHFLQKVITYQSIPSQDVDIVGPERTLTVDPVKMSPIHFYK